MSIQEIFEAYEEAAKDAHFEEHGWFVDPVYRDDLEEVLQWS